MDILSFIIGLVKGKNQSEDALIKIDDGIDALNNEIVGETPFTVTFVNWDGTELCQIPVYKGDDCPDPIEIGLINRPMKDPTTYYQYEFIGWSTSIDGNVSDNALKKVAGNRTLYAILSTQTRIWLSGYCGRQEGVDEVYYELYADVSREHFPDEGLASRGFLILHIYGSGKIKNYTIDADDNLDTPWNNLATSIGVYKVVIDEGVKELGSYTITRLLRLEEVVLPSTVHSIPKNMAIGISGYKEIPAVINIPSTVHSIDYKAFSTYDLAWNNIKFVFERTDGWEYVPPEYENDHSKLSPLPNNISASDPDSISNFMLVEVDNDNSTSSLDSKAFSNVSMYNDVAFHDR